MVRYPRHLSPSVVNSDVHPPDNIGASDAKLLLQELRDTILVDNREIELSPNLPGMELSRLH